MTTRIAVFVTTHRTLFVLAAILVGLYACSDACDDLWA